MKNQMMKLACALAFVGAIGCSKKAPSCEDVFAHTLSLVPAEMKPMLEAKKDDAIAKCGKLSDEARTCAMNAKTMADLQKCPRS